MASKTNFSTIYGRLFQPVDVAALGLFRILFGFLLCIEAYVVYTPDFVLEYYIKPPFHFPFRLFEIIDPHLTVSQMLILFQVMGLAALGIMFGLCFRLSCLTFFFTFLYAVLYDKAMFYDYHYLILLIVILLLFSGAQRWPALNSLRFKKITSQTTPYWQILLLRFQFWLFTFIVAFQSQYGLAGRQSQCIAVCY